jgi:nitronate monooxygenase
MDSWPDRRILDLFGLEVSIIQAPMAGPGTPELAIAVSDAGGLGSLPCAQLSLEQTRAWSGQAVALARRSLPAGQLTRLLAHQALGRLAQKSAAPNGNHST